MTDEKLIEGRNLIDHGDFTSGWKATWTVTGTHGIYQDADTGKDYLRLMDGATATCHVDLPVRPDSDARYLFSFSYEGLGSKPSTVTIQKQGGRVIFDESFLSRKPQENAGTADPAPLVELRPYEPVELGPLVRDDVNTKLTLLVTAAPGGSREGINITDVKFDLQLYPLALSELSLDCRPIPLPVPSAQAVS